MTNQTFPITPPDELVRQWWLEETYDVNTMYVSRPAFGVELLNLATKASHWGWDQRGATNEAELQQARDEELEACKQVVVDQEWFAWPEPRLSQLHDARRPAPKPPETIEVDGFTYRLVQ